MQFENDSQAESSLYDAAEIAIEEGMTEEDFVNAAKQAFGDRRVEAKLAFKAESRTTPCLPRMDRDG